MPAAPTLEGIPYELRAEVYKYVGDGYDHVTRANLKGETGLLYCPNRTALQTASKVSDYHDVPYTEAHCMAAVRREFPRVDIVGSRPEGLCGSFQPGQSERRRPILGD